MASDKLKELSGVVGDIDWSRPAALYDDRERGHAVSWLGIEEETAFRCDTYLIRDGEQAINPALTVFRGPRNSSIDSR